MYLSKLILNPRNPGARRDAGVPYELHRTLMRGLEHAPDDERLLFRIEPEPGPGGPQVLVQTEVRPDWQPLLDNQYLLQAEGPKSFQPVLEAGQRLRFRLTANPVKKVNVPGKKHSVRVPLIYDRHDSKTTYYDWLERQAARCGFSVLGARDATFRLGYRRGNASQSKANIPHFGVCFDGLLEVTDSEKVVDALRRGIGPAKAFGFGLLSLAPAG